MKRPMLGNELTERDWADLERIFKTRISMKALRVEIDIDLNGPVVLKQTHFANDYPQVDLDVEHPIEEKVADQPILCAHGNDPAECEACMVESDFNHDAAREDRMFGR